jgi:hypothetical protein
MTRLPSDLARAIENALRDLRYGSIEIIVHDAKVVQVVRTERVRLPSRANEPSDGEG